VPLIKRRSALRSRRLSAEAVIPGDYPDAEHLAPVQPTDDRKCYFEEELQDSIYRGELGEPSQLIPAAISEPASELA
jgi:hypothetical protein